jgi:hypothetical protein
MSPNRPDDVATLKALLLAERAAAAKLSGHNQHLRAIIESCNEPCSGGAPRRRSIPISCSGASGACPTASCQSRRSAEAPAAA